MVLERDNQAKILAEEAKKKENEIEHDHQLQESQRINQERQRHKQDLAAALSKLKSQCEEENRLLIIHHQELLHTCQQNCANLESEISELKDKIYNLEVRWD